MSFRSSTKNENEGFVGCGESTNRIEPLRVTTDAVPVGHPSYELSSGHASGEAKVRQAGPWARQTE